MHEEFRPEYRVLETPEGFEAQMSYIVRGPLRWIDLDRHGYFADPDGWNDDEIKVRYIMKDRHMAEAAIRKAQAVNGTNICIAK